MFGLGIPEIILLALAFALLFWGGRKIPDLARALGRFTGEFRKGKEDMEKELKEAKKEWSADGPKKEEKKEE